MSGAVAYKAVLLAATLARLILPPLVIAFMPSRRERFRGLLHNYTALLTELPAL